MTKKEVSKKLSELREAYRKARNAGKVLEAKNIESEGKKYKEMFDQMNKLCGNCHKHPRINLYFCENCEVRK
jgi:septation ring formation regulator EzrA